MTLQECYAALGGDYEDVLGRLHSERLVHKFILKYLDDGSYDLLCGAMAVKDDKEAFRGAHTIKGMCQNLSFTRLLASSTVLSDALRYGWTDEAVPAFEQVKADHLATVAAIRAYQAECEAQEAR